MTPAFVYRVTLTSRHRQSGEPVFVNFECGHRSLFDLVRALNEGVVVGEALFCTATPERGTFEVKKRKPFALGRNGVAHIEPPDGRIVEYREADHAGA